MKKSINNYAAIVVTAVLLGCLAICVLFAFPTIERNRKTKELLCMSAEECIDFLIAQGVEIPDSQDRAYWAIQGKCVVEFTLNDPTFTARLGDGTRNYFSLCVSSAVNHYLGLPAPQDEYIAAMREGQADSQSYLDSLEQT